MTITIELSIDDLPKFLKEVEHKVIAGARVAMIDFGNQSVKDLQQSARGAHITPFTGQLYGAGIKSTVQANGDVIVTAPSYAIMLDSMPSHVVSVQRGRPQLLSWALQARSSSIRDAAQNVQIGKRPSFPLNVTPHPFIQNGMNRAQSKLPSILNDRIQRAFT